MRLRAAASRIVRTSASVVCEKSVYQAPTPYSCAGVSTQTHSSATRRIAEQTSGAASLSLATCAGAPAGSLAMTYAGGRWNASVDTGSIGGPGCYVATASLDGNAAGSFRIDLRGADPAPASSGKAKGKN